MTQLQTFMMQDSVKRKGGFLRWGAIALITVIQLIAFSLRLIKAIIHGIVSSTEGHISNDIPVVLVRDDSRKYKLDPDPKEFPQVLMSPKLARPGKPAVAFLAFGMPPRVKFGISNIIPSYVQGQHLHPFNPLNIYGQGTGDNSSPASPNINQGITDNHWISPILRSVSLSQNDLGTMCGDEVMIWEGRIHSPFELNPLPCANNYKPQSERGYKKIRDLHIASKSVPPVFAVLTAAVGFVLGFLSLVNGFDYLYKRRISLASGFLLSGVGIGYLGLFWPIWAAVLS